MLPTEHWSAHFRDTISQMRKQLTIPVRVSELVFLVLLILGFVLMIP